MAVTQNTYTGNGSTTNYSFTFPYLDTADIKVTLNGTATTAYTLANATTISFTTAPANGTAIRIYRDTDDSTVNATFYPGSAVRSQDLNNSFTQILYKSQETANLAASTDASSIQATATTALNTANQAITASNLATTTANTAQTTADAALPKSGGLMTGAAGIIAGTASAPGLYFSGDSNTGIYSPGADQVAISTNSTQRFAVDNSGRVLINTPSARTNIKIEYGTYTATYQHEVSGQLFQALITGSNSGTTPPGGTTAGWGPYLILARQRSGTVGGNTIVNPGDELGTISFHGSDGTNLIQSAAISAYVDQATNIGANDMPGRLAFLTTSDGATGVTERMRITNNGYIKASNNGTYTDNNALNRHTSTHHFFRNTQNHSTIWATNTNVGNSVENYTSDLPVGAGGAHFVAINGNITSRCFVVGANGNVGNTNNVYGALSDVKLKENIVDANSQWSDIKALQVRKYNFKEGQTHTQIGLIAQEAELVSPGLVNESPDRDAEGNDLGTVTKSVNYSVLYMKAVKALQEAMERIEQLEAKVAALEAQ